MEVVIAQDAEEIGRLVTDAIETLVGHVPDAVLGLATGSSPLVIYAEVARRVQAGRFSLARCRGFTLDEYVGLPPKHPELYRTVIEREMVVPTDIRTEDVQSPDGGAKDLVAACAAYEAAMVDAGGVDLQILGIGTDGHVGFNEPGSSLASRTRVKTLTEQTRRDNARFFGGDLSAVPTQAVTQGIGTILDVPTQAVTQGIGTILDSRHLVLVAMGAAKAEAVHHLVEGPISAMWPATALQLHPHVTVLVDEEAGGRLQWGRYYREAFEAKPDWQGL